MASYIGTTAARAGQLDRVKAYYDATLLDYRVIWTGLHDHALHLGYYGAGARTHRESLLALNATVARFADIGGGDRVLDAGCGWGGTAVWLAREVGCHVVGINVVPHQIELARKFAERHAVLANVDFRMEDYNHTSFPDASFDVVVGIESIVHAEDKRAFIREAFRLLNPRGRLLIAEYMLRNDPPLSAEEQVFIRPWLENWVMPTLLSQREYHALMAETGFQSTKTYDLTTGVKKSVERLAKFAILTWPIAWLLETLTMGEAHVRNRAAVTSMAQGLWRGLWRYNVLVGVK